MDNCLVGDYNHCLSMQPQKMQMEAAFKTCNNNISSSSSNNEYWNTDTQQNVTWTSNNELPYYQANLVDTTSMFSLSQSTSSNTSSSLSPSSSDNSVANEQLWIQQHNVFNTFKTLCGTNADQSSINDKSQSLEYSIPYSFYFSQMMEDGDEGMFFKNENHTPVGYMDIHPVSYSKCQDNQDFSGVHSSECIFQNNQQGLSAINILTHANSSDCGSITGHNTEMSVKDNDYEYIDNSDKNTVPIHHKVRRVITTDIVIFSFFECVNCDKVLDLIFKR